MAGFMREARTYPHGAVASPHYLATAAGLATLASGGNALDAALATNLVLGVVTPYLCGYGGDVLAIVWDGSVHGYVGAGRSPRARRPRECASASDERLSPMGDMPTFGRARGDRARRAARLVRSAGAVGEPIVRRPRDDRAALRGGRVPVDAARLAVLHRLPR